MIRKLNGSNHIFIAMENKKPIFKPGDKIRHKATKITATVEGIKKGEYLLSECYGSHMPIDFQDKWEKVLEN